MLILLFSLMTVVAGIQDCGVFESLAHRLLAGRHHMRTLTIFLVLLPLFSSMFVTNDVALLAFVPFAILVLECVGKNDRVIPVLVLQTLAANLGSMATPFGNPQNLYLYQQYNLGPVAFFGTILPLVLVSLLFLIATCLIGRDVTLSVTFPQPVKLRRKKRLIWLAGLFLLCLLCVFRVINASVLLTVVLTTLLLFGRDLLTKVDYGLLATFVCFFVFAGNVGGHIGLRTVLTGALTGHTALVSGLTSQIISNVPAAVLLSGFTQDWRGLLLGVNLGGLGTPIASLASLISLKLYLRTEGADVVRYLLVFTAVNGVGLLILSLAVLLFHGF